MNPQKRFASIWMTDDPIEKSFRDQIEHHKGQILRLEAQLADYLAGRSGVPAKPTKRRDPVVAKRIIADALKSGIGLTKQEIYELLMAAGWTTTYEGRDFSRIINTNVFSGNIKLAEDGRYYRPSEEERIRILRTNQEKRRQVKEAAGD